MIVDRMHNKLWVCFIAIIGVMIGVFAYCDDSKNYGLRLEAEHNRLEFQGKTYNFRLFRYEPPHILTKPVISREKSGASTPEEVVRAYLSTAGRDIDWVWALYDQPASAKLKKTIENEFPDYFDGWDASKPPPSDLKKVGDEALYEEFIYKIEYEMNAITYAIIVARVVKEGKKYNLVEKRFSKNGDAWYFTQDIDDDPFADAVSGLDYGQLIRFLETADPIVARFPETAPQIETEVRASKLSYEFGEPLEFSFTMKNVSSKPIRIFGGVEPLGRGCRIIVKKGEDSGMIGVTKDIQLKPVQAGEYILLEPGQIVSARYLVSEYKQSSDGRIHSTGALDGGIPELPEGTLTASIAYMPPVAVLQDKSKPADLFMQGLESKPVTFELKPRNSQA